MNVKIDIEELALEGFDARDGERVRREIESALGEHLRDLLAGLGGSQTAAGPVALATVRADDVRFDRGARSAAGIGRAIGWSVGAALDGAIRGEGSADGSAPAGRPTLDARFSGAALGAAGKSGRR